MDMSSAAIPLPHRIPDAPAPLRTHWVTRAFAGSGKRVMALVIVVVLLTLASSMAALLTARSMERAMNAMVTQQLRGMQTAADLQSALLRQRGMVTAYMLDEGGLPWLNDLDR